MVRMHISVIQFLICSFHFLFRFFPIYSAFQPIHAAFLLSKDCLTCDCVLYLLGHNLVLFLALASSANEHCRKASAHGEFYLFGFRLEFTPQLQHFGVSHWWAGGRCQRARISRCGPHWGSRGGRCVPWEQGRDIDGVIPPLPSCAGHSLQSPGLGGRVLAYWQD